LSICRSIVEAQGGQMWLADDTGGADFPFTMPAIGAAAPEPVSLAAATRA